MPLAHQVTGLQRISETRRMRLRAEVIIYMLFKLITLRLLTSRLIMHVPHGRTRAAFASPIPQSLSHRSACLVRRRATIARRYLYSRRH